MGTLALTGYSQQSKKLRRRLLRAALALLLPASATVAAPAIASTAATTCSADAIALTNAGFESPAIRTKSYAIMSEANVPGWSTTAADRQIELWSTGFGNVPAAEGSQFAELNATMTSALFQDVETTPGTAVTWSLAHRGRAGVDTMRVVIGPPGGPLKEVARMADGNTTWGRHSGTYVIPAKQTVTRFAFEAVSTAGGDPTIGNFLDDIAFGTPACIVLTKSAQIIGDPVPGGIVRWTVTATNKGGGPAQDLVINDTSPLHTSYAPGSLRVTTGPRAGALTDAADSDAGTVSAQEISWKPVGSSHIAGRLNPGESATVSFDSVIKTSGAGATIANTASATYTADAQPRTARSNIAEVTVDETADVYVTKTFDSATVSATAGSAAATFTVVVGNHGPFAADHVVVTDLLPSDLVVDVTGITATGGGAAPICALAPDGARQRLSCNFGTLSAKSMRVISIPATFTKATPGAISVENSAAVTTSSYDTDLSNNVSTSEMVFDPGLAADVAVTVTAANDSAVMPGDEVGWILNVFNATAVGLSATGVTVTATVPVDATQVKVPSNCSLVATTLTCVLGTIDAGGRVQLRVNAVADAAVADGATMVLQAHVSADAGSNSDTNNDTDSAAIPVTRPAELTIVKRALDPVTQGLTRFDVTVTSVGRFEARNVILTDRVSNATLVSAPDSCDPTTTPVVCTLGTLAVGASVTLDFTFQAESLGQIIDNRASAKADNANEVDSRAAAPRIIPEFGEAPLPEGLPAAPEPPQLARTGGAAEPLLWLVVVFLTAGVLLLRRRLPRRG